MSVCTLDTVYYGIQYIRYLINCSAQDAHKSKWITWIILYDKCKINIISISYINH